MKSKVTLKELEEGGWQGLDADLGISLYEYGYAWRENPLKIDDFPRYTILVGVHVDEDYNFDLFEDNVIDIFDYKSILASLGREGIKQVRDYIGGGNLAYHPMSFYDIAQYHGWSWFGIGDGMYPIEVIDEDGEEEVEDELQ